MTPVAIFHAWKPALAVRFQPWPPSAEGPFRSHGLSARRGLEHAGSARTAPWRLSILQPDAVPL